VVNRGTWHSKGDGVWARREEREEEGERLCSNGSGNGDDGREGLAATVAGESRRPAA